MSRPQPDAASTIEYRAPGVGAHRVQVVAQLIARGEAINLATACGKVVLGLLLTLVGPFLLTIIVVGVADRLPYRRGPGFPATFGFACLLMMPLLLGYERRTRGRFFDHAIQGEVSPLRASSYGEFELQKSKMMWMAYVESALLGPRLLWHVYDWARETPNVHQPTRVLAAEMAVELLDAGEGIPLKRLLHSGRSPAEVGRAIRYLQAREWIDVSRSRDRVWLTSPARGRLEKVLRDLSHRDHLPGMSGTV